MRLEEVRLVQPIVLRDFWYQVSGIEGQKAFATVFIPRVAGDHAHINQAVTNLSVLRSEAHRTQLAAVEGNEIQATQCITTEHIPCSAGHVTMRICGTKAIPEVNSCLRIVGMEKVSQVLHDDIAKDAHLLIS